MSLILSRFEKEILSGNYPVEPLPNFNPHLFACYLRAVLAREQQIVRPERATIHLQLFSRENARTETLMQTTDSPAVQAALARHEERRSRIVELPPHRFEFGVYQAPLVLVGDEVQCARFGCVIVVGWSEGPLRWPQCHINGPRSLILFGDLERAVELESADAVAVALGRFAPHR